MTTLLDWSARTDLIDLVPLEARTTSGAGSAFNVQPFTGRAVFLLESTAGSGTAPLLNAVRLQDSPDGVSSWVNVTDIATGLIQFASVTTAPSLQWLTFDVSATRGFLRVGWSITGTTPSFTFSCLLLARLT